MITIIMVHVRYTFDIMMPCVHPSWVVLLEEEEYQLQVTRYEISCHAFSRFNLFGAEKVREVQWRHFLLDLSFRW